ncbi:MAG TPA: 2-oxoglutarate dehydrogenase complex dihydrolipoyllysine-residue succinyltransferase [Acidobacteriota bacterium]
MAHEIKVPSVGESVSEARIARWLKQDGDTVAMDEPILELETDKANMELNADQEGTLKIQKPAGESVAPGEVIGLIEEGGKSTGKTEARAETNRDAATARRGTPDSAAGTARDRTSATAAKAGEPGLKKKDTERSEAQPQRPSEKEREVARQEKAQEDKAQEDKAQQDKAQQDKAREDKAPQDTTQQETVSPAVRKLLREHDLDVNSVPGTGKGGRVRKEDVLNFVRTTKTEAAPRPVAVPMPSRQGQDAVSAPPSQKASHAQTPARHISGERSERVEPMSLLRQKIAERMVRAQQTAAILTTFNEIDMAAVTELRARHKESFQQKHGVGLGLMPFFVKACIEALQMIPALNAIIDGKNIVYRDYYDIGVAVATDRGLVVPVLRDADKMSFAEIETATGTFAKKAREGTISVDELTGGTFTITNGGIFGSLFSTPILNPPQSGILGMHTIQKRPMVVNDQIVIRPMMYVALSYDHRIVDGKEAVTFLMKIKHGIEDPTRLMLGI